MVSLNFNPVNHRRVKRKDKNKNLKINKSILLLNPLVSFLSTNYRSSGIYTRCWSQKSALFERQWN